MDQEWVVVLILLGLPLYLNTILLMQLTVEFRQIRSELQKLLLFGPARKER